MFGRASRVAALAAVLTHLWVSLVVAPWHHLVAHRMPGVESPKAAEPVRSVSHCQCRRHAHPACDGSRQVPRETPSPASPHHHDACQVCQILTQPITAPEAPVPLVTPQRIAWSAPVCAVQPWLEPLRAPVSRGPPCV